jgi:hypothetical protein
VVIGMGVDGFMHIFGAITCERRSASVYVCRKKNRQNKKTKKKNKNKKQNKTKKTKNSLAPALSVK